MIRSLILRVTAAALLVAGVIHSSPLTAQVPAPTAEQLELLRNLTPEQREQILRQITGAGGGGTISSTPRDRAERGLPDTEQEAERDRRALERMREREAEEEETRNGMPLLKGDDTVIIRIQLKQAQPGSALRGQPQQGGVVLPGAGTSVVAPGTPPGGTSVPAQQNGGAIPSPAQSRPPELTQEEREQRQKLVELILSRNPYRLTREGVLQLPGFPGIPLAGLTEFEATVRLQADPELRDFDVNLIRLPLKKIGTEALKPFGYDLFERAPSTFAPVTNVPVPADYIVGPGDEFDVQLYGNQNRTLRLVVGRDGVVSFPELGPINVAGQRFTTVKQTIEERVERQMIGVRASLSMGDTRAIRVFVLGEATRPGSYTISGLGTITSALFAAGGVKPIGSLRNIQLKRQGVVVRNFDLYDMLIRGDTTDDARLLPGDVVFIPPVGPTITVQGEVRRPAIYEVTKNSTIADVVDLAGGLTAEADISKASLTRITENQQRVVISVSLTGAEASAQSVRNGDVLQISRLKPTLDSGVVVQGHVFSPATYAYREGLRLTDVIRSVDELKPNADINYLLIRRELPPNRQVTVLSADLGAALNAPGSEQDVLLMPRDRIIVFDLETSRERIIRPLMNELRTQSNFNRPTEIVSVDGQVRVPGEYPLEPGMRVSDLIRAGGNLTDAAYGGKAELTRYRVVNGDTRRTEQIQIDLAAILRGDPAADIALEPFDSLSIKEVPEWDAQQYVTILGEVRFPGRYSIKQGETLKSVIQRAGGLTDFAFPEGSVFTREELKRREQRQIDELATRMQNDLITLALQGAAANQAQAGTALAVGQSLLTQLRGAQAVGRLVIDLPRALRAPPGSGADIVLRDGDRLIVPKFQQEVTVIGEVQTTTSHLYRPELGRDDYIALSGGLTRRADAERIYVVRANGAVVTRQGGRWFSRDSVDIKPGDTVVVPLNTEKLPALPFWQAVTSIIYNLAIAAAAVNSF
ncbi:MAG: SLBB domain-containing protein [Steroidobacteraceae bacterium]|nr:SLBB domain-containing protein [Steroidobacteraceae bacterium]